ncbi:MAG TPA: hypothetical protein VF266_24785 [Thermoanaerobaculia bacterium]
MSSGIEGVLHVIYASHGSEADFERIEADLGAVAARSRRLVFVFEDVLPLHLLYERLDPSLRGLPPHVLLDDRTVRRNREEIARAYASAMSELESVYRAWNVAPPERRATLSGEPGPFNRRLLLWAAANGAELVRGETSLEAWLVQMSWIVARQMGTAVATGDPAAVWAEHRRECELLARAIQLRDLDLNAQLTRLLRVERRGHDALYVVGALHSASGNLLTRGLKAIVHQGHFIDDSGVRLVRALIEQRLDDEPPDVREWLETFVFVSDRLQPLARPAASVSDIARLTHRLDGCAAARGVTLRQIVDSVIADPAVRQSAGAFESRGLRVMTGVALVLRLIDGGFIARAELETDLRLQEAGL